MSKHVAHYIDKGLVYRATLFEDNSVALEGRSAGHYYEALGRTHWDGEQLVIELMGVLSGLLRRERDA